MIVTDKNREGITMDYKTEKRNEVLAIIDAMKNSNTELIFGREIEKDGKLIIPVSKFESGLGFGYGSSMEEGSKEELGGGGGFGVKVKPVGYIEISESTTRFVKISEFSIKSAIIGSAIGVGLYIICKSRKKKKTCLEKLISHIKN